MASRQVFQSCLRSAPSLSRPLTSKLLLPSFVSSTRLYQHKRTMSLSVVSTTNAPAAVGPYSQAIKTENLVFVSGCIPLDPKTGAKVGGDNIKEQATQALANMKGIVEASGSSIDKIAKCTVFLQNMDHFADANKVYTQFFGDHRPARSCVEVAKLPLGVLFEIECIAVLP